MLITPGSGQSHSPLVYVHGIHSVRGWTGGGSGNGNAGDAGDTCDWPAASQWRARTSVTAPVTVEQRDRRHCGWPTSRLQAQARRQSIQPLPRQNGGHCSKLMAKSVLAILFF